MPPNSNPQIWPPDRGAFKHGSPQQQEDSSTFDKIIRYAEKDDVLLYATALFGIVMPAIMYFVYKAAHSKYQVYAKRKREERRRERAKKRTITFLYMNGLETNLKRLSFSFAEQLGGYEPLVLPLIPSNLNIFYNYKGIVIFIVPDNDPAELSEQEGWFFDWLQEMRFQANEQSLLSTLKYAIFTVTNKEQENVLGKMCNTLTKRLNALEAKEIQPPNFIWNNKDTDMELQLEHQAELLSESMKLAWEEYDSDQTDLMSAEDTMSDFSEPEEHDYTDETEQKKTK